MPFFVEPSQDEYRNRAYTNSFPCVVKALRIAEGYRIVAPPEIADKWSIISRRIIESWVRCDGPARPISRAEQNRLCGEGPNIYQAMADYDNARDIAPDTSGGGSIQAK